MSLACFFLAQLMCLLVAAADHLFFMRLISSVCNSHFGFEFYFVFFGGLLALYILNPFFWPPPPSGFSRRQDALQAMTGRRSVPNVFVGGSSIGGCDDTLALAAAGKLQPLLEEAVQRLAAAPPAVSVAAAAAAAVAPVAPPAAPAAATAATVAAGGDALAGERASVQSTVSSSPLVMYSKTTCPYCRRAAAVLERAAAEAGCDLLTVQLDTKANCSAMQVAV